MLFKAIWLLYDAGSHLYRVDVVEVDFGEYVQCACITVQYSHLMQWSAAAYSRCGHRLRHQSFDLVDGPSQTLQGDLCAGQLSFSEVRCSDYMSSVLDSKGSGRPGGFL